MKGDGEGGQWVSGRLRREHRHGQLCLFAKRGLNGTPAVVIIGVCAIAGAGFLYYRHTKQQDAKKGKDPFKKLKVTRGFQF